MKYIISILMLFMVVSPAVAKQFVIAAPANVYISELARIEQAEVYIMFRSDFQTTEMTNGARWQLNCRNWVAKTNNTMPYYYWAYDEKKAQKIPQIDRQYIKSNFLYHPEVQAGFVDDWETWLRTWAEPTSEGVTNVCPLVRGAYNDKDMQEDKIKFISIETKSVTSNKEAIIVSNWIDIYGTTHTPAHSNAVLDAIIGDRLYSLANTNNFMDVIWQDIKNLENESLQARDDFRVELDEPNKSFIGFFRMSQKPEFLRHYGLGDSATNKTEEVE